MFNSLFRSAIQFPMYAMLISSLIHFNDFPTILRIGIWVAATSFIIHWQIHKGTLSCNDQPKHGLRFLKIRTSSQCNVTFIPTEDQNYWIRIADGMMVVYVSRVEVADMVQEKLDAISEGKEVIDGRSY